MRSSYNLKHRLCLLIAIAGIVMPGNLNGQGIIQEESQVPAFRLPDVLRKADGQQVTTAIAWEEQLRPETLKAFENLVYGKTPSKSVNVSYKERLLETGVSLVSGSVREITFTFKTDGNELQATLLLILPKSKDPAPLFVGYNFKGNHTISSLEGISLPQSWVANDPEIGVTSNKGNELSRGAASSRWPVEKILGRGYGLATMYYGDIDPDFNDGFANGVHGLFNTDRERGPGDWGSIAAWAWGLSRIMDYLGTNPLINPEKVAVLGHSRLGKAALWAGANDRRFSLVISNNSGCGGAALSKRKFGETVAAINDRFPHWFCGNFKQYNHREDTLPIDQHQLIALMAPRPVYVASAEEDKWADPYGEFSGASYASPVYALYGLEGLHKNSYPSVNQPVMTAVMGYHVRSGGHDITAYDWEQFMDFADSRL